VGLLFQLKRSVKHINFNLYCNFIFNCQYACSSIQAEIPSVDVDSSGFSLLSEWQSHSPHISEDCPEKSWEKRMRHIANHFDARMTMSEARPDFLPKHPHRKNMIPASLMIKLIKLIHLHRRSELSASDGRPLPKLMKRTSRSTEGLSHSVAMPQEPETDEEGYQIEGSPSSGTGMERTKGISSGETRPNWASGNLDDQPGAAHEDCRMEHSIQFDDEGADGDDERASDDDDGY
jgi:hypothetical protein